MATRAGSAPSTYSPSTQKRKQTRLDLKDPDWVRSDGRLFHQCRPAFFRTGAVTAAAGSAYAELGDTKVIVSVFGPRESKKAMMYSDTGRLNCNVSYTTFATSVRGQGSDHKEFSSMLHKALEGAIILESFPKTTVDVFALVLETSGSDLPLIVSCASLALADAGIMIYDLVTAVSVSCHGSNLILDPLVEEESYQEGSLMITYMPSREEVTQLTITGEWSPTRIHEAMNLCLSACSNLGNVMRSCLKEAAAAASDDTNE
ncbi:Exosome complex component RRP41-like [Dionaea muscipula]